MKLSIANQRSSNSPSKIRGGWGALMLLEDSAYGSTPHSSGAPRHLP